MTLKYCVCDRLFFRIHKDHWEDADGYHWNCPTCGRQIDREYGFVEPSKIASMKLFMWLYVIYYFGNPFDYIFLGS